MKIIPARQSDAQFIAECIMDAVGEEICLALASNGHTLDDVKTLFTKLALEKDTQYSYLNTLVAVDDEGTAVGACVAYDGARLHSMREHFFRLAQEILDRDMRGVEDECVSDEFYLDTLAVRPEYRGRGIAGDLIRATIERAGRCGKTPGLLVEKENHNARRLYEKIGFRKVDERPFAYVLMDHLQYRPV